jgi:hypothetical protein
MTDLTGAYGVVRTTGWIGALIRWSTRLPGIPERFAVNHAFLAVSATEMVEMNPKGAALAPIDKYAGSSWFRPPLTDAQTIMVAAAADGLYEHRVGYGFLDIAAQFACRKLHFRPRWFKRWIADPKRMVCSQSADWCFDQAGVHLFKDLRPAGLVSPNDLLELGIDSGWEITLIKENA